MRVLVIGSGAREHALLLALRRDPQVEHLSVAPGNAGTAAVAEQHDVDVTSAEAVTGLAKRIGADLVVVGPEVPLVLGVADAVRAAGIACFGPTRDAARIEGSKAFAKDVMSAAGVRTALCETVDNPAHLDAALDRFGGPGLGTEFDPCNYYHAGIEPFPYAYDLIRHHVRYVHLKGGSQYHGGVRGLHKGYPMRDSNRDFIAYVPLPEAAFNVEAMIRALARDGYRGWLTLEPHVTGTDIIEFYRREVPYVKRLLAELRPARRR